MIRVALVGALEALCALGAARADEVWETQGGFAVYEADVGTTAVLRVPTEDLGEVYVYIPGLGGMWGERRRQSYDAYFVGAEPGGPCEAALQATNDRQSQFWGEARVVLTERAFPTGLFVLLKPCDGREEVFVFGKPVTP